MVQGYGFLTKICKRFLRISIKKTPNFEKRLMDSSLYKHFLKYLLKKNKLECSQWKRLMNHIWKNKILVQKKALASPLPQFEDTWTTSTTFRSRTTPTTPIGQGWVQKNTGKPYEYFTLFANSLQINYSNVKHENNFDNLSASEFGKTTLIPTSLKTIKNFLFRVWNCFRPGNILTLFRSEWKPSKKKTQREKYPQEIQLLRVFIYWKRRTQKKENYF